MIRLKLVDKIIAKLLFWRRISIQREELGKMSDELLKDIGISRAEAAREAQRHFWDTDHQLKRKGNSKTSALDHSRRGFSQIDPKSH